MKQLKYILPLLLTIITLAIYNPIEAQSSTSNYSFTFLNETWINRGNFATHPFPTRATSKTQIINNTINIETELWTYINFWNNNTFLGHYINPTFLNPDPYWTGVEFLGYWNNQFPVNATHFAFHTDTSHITPTFTQFQTLIVSHSTPVQPPVTTTFPNINFIDNQNIGVISGLPTQQTNFMRTDLIDISTLPTTWNLTGPNRVGSSAGYVTTTHYYDENYNYLGWTGTELWNASNQNAPNRFGFTRFINSTDESLIDTYMTTTKYIAYSVIKNITVGSDLSNEGYTYINPPSGTANYTDWQTYQFVTNQVLVQFATFDGQTIFYSEWITIGTDITNLSNSLSNDPNLPREGFSFTGFSGSNIVPSTNPYLRLAQYNQLQQYTVTFLDYDNTTLGTDTVFEGQPASPPLIPTRFGYTFTGWEPPISNIQGNITTVAQYTPNQYMVTWISDGITIKSQLENHDSVFQTLAPPVTKENHVLIGWNFQGTTTPLQLDGTLIGASSFEAVWVPVPTYTVVWRDVDFNTLKIEYVIESGIAVAPNYVPASGFVLVGWTPDPTQPISQNTTFVAVVQATPTAPTIPSDYSPISDLFGGVIGASIGAVMTLGTIDLYGIQLSSIIYLFVSMSLGLWILKAIRG
jgi:hypothetical protein